MIFFFSPEPRNQVRLIEIFLTTLTSSIKKAYWNLSCKGVSCLFYYQKISHTVEALVSDHLGIRGEHKGTQRTQRTQGTKGTQGTQGTQGETEDTRDTMDTRGQRGHKGNRVHRGHKRTQGTSGDTRDTGNTRGHKKICWDHVELSGKAAMNFDETAAAPKLLSLLFE